jgi:predicted aldo/keto reductase-like oxidoreductase
LDRCFARDGAIHALTEARDQGLVRYLGITGHSDAGILAEAVHRFPFDSVLFTAAPVDPGHADFLGELLPAARARGTAVVGMRALAGGSLRDLCPEALRYGLGLPLSILLVGCSTVAQLEKDVAIAETCIPFEDPERQDFLRRARLVPIRSRPF